MESISEPTPTKYQQVTVDVPEERLAEFHAFFARFLAGRGRRGRRGEYRRHAHGHGHGCAARHERAGAKRGLRGSGRDPRTNPGDHRGLVDGRQADHSCRTGGTRPGVLCLVRGLPDGRVWDCTAK